MNELVRELDALRSRAGDPSLRDLAESTGINRTSLSEYFRGTRQPTRIALQKLADVLHGDFARLSLLVSSTQSSEIVSTEQDSIQCFLSYSHTDNEEMQFVDAFKKSLEYFALANRGRRLEVFLDRHSISWGEDWSHSIRQSVLGATVFVPIVTLSYFQSSWCRQELLLFYKSADSLGVTELLLPIVVFGQQAINAESDDEVARIISARQYKDLQGAFLDGIESATWRKALLDVANSLVDAVESAEKRLPGIVQQAESKAFELNEVSGELPEEQDGLSELNERAADLGPKIAESVGQYIAQVEEVGRVLNDPRSKPKDGAWDARVFTLLAARLQKPSEAAAQFGRELEGYCAEADSVIRQVGELLDLAGMDGAKSELAARFVQTAASAQLGSTEQAIDELLSSMIAAEVLSVALRKSVRPLRNSLRSVKSASRMIASWEELFLTED